MDVEFGDPELATLESTSAIAGAPSQAIAKMFRRRMQFIRAANDERDFYAMRSWHFEKLKGNRAHQHSIRLNDQWRLVVELIDEAPKKKVRIVSIEDYH